MHLLRPLRAYSSTYGAGGAALAALLLGHLFDAANLVKRRTA